MPLLPSLIKRIDNFCKIADYYSLISVAAPDDKTLLSDLETAAREVVNPDVSYTLQILADVYRKVLQINGGFNTLYLMVQGILEDLDPEEDEQVNVETLLNKIRKSLELRAERPDSPGAMRELQMAASEAKRRLAEQAPDVPEEDDRDEDEVSPYEASILGYGGAQQAFEEEGGVAKFDPTGGVSPEAAQSGKGRGYSVGKAHTYKDWAALYATEREKYQRDMEGPDTMLTTAARRARKDANVMTNLRILVDTLVKLEALTKEAVKLEQQILIETEVPHPKEEARLAEIREELRKLEHNRGLLKRNLNKYYKTSQLESLQQEESAPGKSDREKLLLQQKIKLQELRLSGAYGYGKEARERQRLIDSLTADPNLPVTEIKKKMDAIQDATAFTNRITKAQYDRKRTEQKGEQEGRVVPTRPAGRGGALPSGWRQMYQIDFDTATYPLLLKKLRDYNNTAVSDARKYIMRPHEKGDPALAPYVEAISAAIRKKDNNSKFQAINALKAKIAETLVKSSSLKGYLQVLRLSPHFKRIEEALFDIKGKQGPDGKWNLSPEDKANVRTALENIERLKGLYARYYQSKESRKFREQPYAFFTTVTEYFPKLADYVYKNILQEEPAAKAEKQAANKEPTKRMELLARMLEEQNLYKMAQEVASGPEEVDEATADRMAKDIFDQLFDAELQKLYSQSL